MSNSEQRSSEFGSVWSPEATKSQPLRSDPDTGGVEKSQGSLGILLGTPITRIIKP